MSIPDKTESPDIIEEIIPGKNQDNNNIQQPFIENYDEKESAQEVIEASEEPIKTIEKNTDESSNRFSNYSQVITDNQKQTAQSTRQITENCLEFQKQVLNSFQSYFQNICNQFWNSQEYFRSTSQMYSKLMRNYTTSAIDINKMWSDIAFTNLGLFNNKMDRYT
jgi:hypothetical protein